MISIVVVNLLLISQDYVRRQVTREHHYGVFRVTLVQSSKKQIPMHLATLCVLKND